MKIAISRRDFYEALLRSFDKDETRTLCSIVLGIDYDDLAGESLAAKQRELIAYFERRDRNGELIGAVVTQRPNLLTLDTGRLGPLFRVAGQVPDPMDRLSFHTEMARREIHNEIRSKGALTLLISVMIAQFVIIVLLMVV